MDNSNERRKRWIAAHPDLVAKPSMKRRKVGHDYCGVAVYLVTLCIEGRRPILGTLCDPDASHKKPWVQASSIGAAVKQAWHEIPRYHPQVKLLGFQLMPDHVHGIIHVTEPMPRHLGHLIQGLRKAAAMPSSQSFMKVRHYGKKVTTIAFFKVEANWTDG